MIKVIRKLKSFLRKYWINQVLIVFFLSLSYFATFIKPWAVGKVADSIINDSGYSDVFFYLLIFSISIVLTYLINAMWRIGLAINRNSISRDTRNTLMKKILKQSPRFFEVNSTGSLMAKATSDVDALTTMVGYGYITIFDGIIYPIGLISLMFVISWKLSIFSLFLFPLFVILVKRIDKIFEIKIKAVQDSFYEMNNKALEDVSSIKVVRAFNVESIFKENFIKKIKNNYEAENDKNQTVLLYNPLANVFITIVNCLSLLGGAYLISKGEMTVGQLITFTMYVRFLDWPAFALSDLFAVSKDAEMALDRLDEVLTYPEDLEDKKDAISLGEIRDISFVDYAFSYPTEDRLILKNINLHIKAGDTLVLVGKTGSGKSTLLKQFLRLYDKADGSIKVNGLDIENYKRASLIDEISYVPQDNYLFSKSIRENVRLFRNFSEEEILEALATADFKKDLDNFPDGLNTMTGEKGVALSGGQRQRIALARALIKESPLIILDDVFSAVDTKTEKKIIENLDKNREGKTNIYASHRLSIIRPDDRVVVLEDGQIVCQGRHREVYNNNPWYRTQYDRQKYGKESSQIEEEIESLELASVNSSDVFLYSHESNIVNDPDILNLDRTEFFEEDDNE